MCRTISIGAQSFEKLRTLDCFYIDKTAFIKEWWEAKDEITLITRPRRFGKTLNMNMLECFFSNRYAARGELFEGLSIWKEENYRQLQGTYPVISLSFAGIKRKGYRPALYQIKAVIADLYEQYRFLANWEGLSINEQKHFASMQRGMPDDDVADSLRCLCRYLSRYYGKNVIILLDEYDTPVQEAWLGGYWAEFTDLLRSFFNNTFKTNPYLERAVMTGITRVSRESIFSDMNNMKVVTTTGDLYADRFGFTEKEVFAALDEMGMSAEKEKVKAWYDGFTFGSHTDIYNPWSITNFLEEKKYRTWWADTSSNGLADQLIRTGSPELKQDMEILLCGGSIEVKIDEQIVFDRLQDNDEAVWSLLLASGYLKISDRNIDENYAEDTCLLSVTNLETRRMFEKMLASWLKSTGAPGNAFIRSLLSGELRAMNAYMNDIAAGTFSYYDVGNGDPHAVRPERFYHGFVLGLLADLRDKYELRSNRESGYGRYDVMLIPKRSNDPACPAIVMEFKTLGSDDEKTLRETVDMAKKQIEDKNYDAELLARGIRPEFIRHYGFAFAGKTVLIG